MTVKISFNLLSIETVIAIIIYGILGYFVYDQSTDAAIIVMGISVAVWLITLLSLIPIIGWIASMLIIYYWAIPTILEMGGLEYTWLMTVIFGMSAISGLFTTIGMILVIRMILKRRR